MATKNFRSTVLEPTSEFAHGDKLRFTALATVGEVLKGSFSETTIGEDGVYSVDLQYGKHRIDYKPYEGVWRHFADVEVNADTLATTLQDLALASVPVTDETVLVLQGILADAEAVKTETASIRDEAAASAAAAAEDAAKLADVTPESIGAVNADSGTVSVKIDSSYIAMSSGRYVVLTLPVWGNTMIGLQLRIVSRQLGASGDIFVSFQNYTATSSAITGSYLHKTSTRDYTVDVYQNAATEKTYLVVYHNESFVDACFSIVNLVTGYQTSGAYLWNKNWTAVMTDSLADLGIKRASISSIASKTTPYTVREIEHDGKIYTHTGRESALEVDGIPYEVFDAALAEQQAGDLFESEKSIALQIFADFNLGTGEQEITGADIADVRAYIQSIDPAKGLKAGHLQRAKIPRPSIFDRYS